MQIYPRISAFLLFGFFFLSVAQLHAQNESDALRYGRYYYTGTARYAGMGGAFGALGADMSNMANNPAGIGLFRKHQITLTPGVSVNTSKSVFQGETQKDTRSAFNLANLGFVYSAKVGKGRNSPYSGWQFVNVGLGYTKTSDFNKQVLIRGVNSQNSWLDIFESNANQGYLDPYYESLAINSQLLVVDSSTGKYYSFLPPWPDAGKLQRKSIEGKGSMGDMSFALSGNYANRLYIGASFNISVLAYQQTSFYTESDAGDSVPDFKDYTIKEYFRTRGSGISGKFGIIYRPADFIRIGLSVHTPTLYSLTDNYTTDFNANFDGGGSTQALSPLGVYKYRFTNPFRVQLSTGFVLGKFALIGLEYEYVGYNSARYRNTSGSTDEFASTNDRIKGSFRGGHIVKAGGELRLEPVSIRAGLNYATSPYQPGVNNSSDWGVSCGLGYRNSPSGFFMDAAYTLFSNRETYWMYDASLAPPVDMRLMKHNILLTFGFNF